MGKARDKVLPLPQREVELTNAVLHRLCHLVEGVAERPDFIVCSQVNSLVIRPLRDAAAGAVELFDRRSQKQ